jgi:hypothetical protein
MDPGPPAANGHSSEDSFAESDAVTLVNEPLADDDHPGINGTLTLQDNPSHSRERSLGEIRQALRREWRSDNTDFVGILPAEQIISTTLYRLAQRHRLFNLAAPERRQEWRSLLGERLNNERLSRILQLHISDEGALDLFRTIQSEILWEMAFDFESEEVLRPRSASDNTIQGPISVPYNADGESTIAVTVGSRNQVMRATRRALGMIQPIPYNLAIQGRQLEPVESIAGSPAMSSYNGDRRTSAIVRCVSPTISFRTALFANMWTNIREQSEKKHIRQEIEATSTAKLAPPLNETELIQSLVLQFLTHDGYVETAKAFSEEVHAEKKALSLDPNAAVNGFEVKEDEDAGHRQR